MARGAEAALISLLYVTGWGTPQKTLEIFNGGGLDPDTAALFKAREPKPGTFDQTGPKLKVTPETANQVIPVVVYSGDHDHTTAGTPNNHGQMGRRAFHAARAGFKNGPFRRGHRYQQ